MKRNSRPGQGCDFLDIALRFLFLSISINFPMSRKLFLFPGPQLPSRPWESDQGVIFAGEKDFIFCVLSRKITWVVLELDLDKVVRNNVQRIGGKNTGLHN